MQLKTEITDADIKELELTSGLEIHQQFEGRKLFCNCPTVLRDDTPDFLIKRFIRASAGESGAVDIAAAQEIKKKKHYFYEGYTDTTCLVELDEEPPQPLSQDALLGGMQVAKLLDMRIVDQLRFMRKIVVNGSNTSGFQRTALLATNGTLETTHGPVGIDSLNLEEDSCKDVEKTRDYTIYNLSRLGIPLLELATAPDLHTPEHVAETAEHIGMVLRSLPSVKRGLGTIRQDVNISIKEGVRVEIKGAQDLKMIPTLVRYEMLRQHNLLQLFAELKKRKASIEEKDGEAIVHEITALHGSQSKVIRLALDDVDGAVYAIKLFGFAGLVGQETQPGRRLGSEYSDYAKHMGVKGLFHSDELPKYGITQEEKDEVYKELALNPETDAFLLIADNKEKARSAIIEAGLRAADFSLRKEVRVAQQDGTTKYLRPMPGASRMYPETDVAPRMLSGIEVPVPQLLSEKISELASEFGIAEDIAKRLLRDGIDLRELHKQFPELKVSFMIDSLYSLPASIEKKYAVQVSQENVLTLLEKLHAKEITKDSFEELSLLLGKGEVVDFADYAPLSLESIRDDVKKIVEGMGDAPRGAIMGKVMAAYKGKVPGQELAKLVNSFL